MHLLLCSSTLIQWEKKHLLLCSSTLIQWEKKTSCSGKILQLLHSSTPIQWKQIAINTVLQTYSELVKTSISKQARVFPVTSFQLNTNVQARNGISLRILHVLPPGDSTSSHEPHGLPPGGTTAHMTAVFWTPALSS